MARALIGILVLLVAAPGCAATVTQAELEETRRALEDSSRDLDAAAAQLEDANARLAVMEEEQERMRGETELITQQLRAGPDSAWDRAQTRQRRIAKAKARAERAAGGTTEPREDRSVEGAEEAIECARELECIVDRDWLLRTLETDVPSQARIVPSQKNGEVQGLKFYGIRLGSVPKLLGLKNGDMVLKIGGTAVRSLDDLVREIVDAKGVVEVDLVRKGKPMTGTVTIK